MIIKVTQKHIKNGKRFSACYDPIAVAMRDNGFKLVTVGNNSINYYTDDFKKENDYDMPEDLKDWVHRYDRGERMRVTQFEIPD